MYNCALFKNGYCNLKKYVAKASETVFNIHYFLK